MTASRSEHRGGWLLPGALAGAAIGILLADPAASPTWPSALVGPVAAIGAVVVILGLVGVRRSAGRIGTPGTLWWTALAAGGFCIGCSIGIVRAEGVALPRGPGSVSAIVAGAGSESGKHAVSGRVLDDPRPKQDRQQLVLERLVIDGRPAPGRILAWLPRAVLVGSGDRVAFSASLEQPRDFAGFAYRAYLARQGIGGVARTFAGQVVASADGPAAAVAQVRRWLLGGLESSIPEPEASLGAGILLGVRTSIDPAVSDAFAVAGLTHIVAISGWNIAIVAALVARLLGGLRRRRGGQIAVPLVTIVAIAGFVVLVGSSPSVVRAALMAGALLLGRRTGSTVHAISALMLAALVMLVAAPPVLWDVGFQLSLLATIGLILFGAAVEGRLREWPGWAREPVALTLAAQLTTLPVILVTFDRLSLVAPLANVVVAPMVPLVMLASAVAAGVGGLDAWVHLPVVGDAASWFAGGSAWLGLRTMITAGGAAAAVPFASLPIAPPAWLPLAWYPLLALAFFHLGNRRRRTPASQGLVGLADRPPSTRGRRWMALIEGGYRAAARAAAGVARPRRALAVLVGVLAVSTLATLPDGKLHAWMLDIGQGDAILLQAPSGSTMLVDGGPDPDLLLRRVGASLPWWRRSIDHVLLTHPHQDHVGGLTAVLERFRVGETIDPGRRYANPTYDRFLALAAAEPGGRYRLARAGDTVVLDRASGVSFLYPSREDAAAPLPLNDINNASAVGILTMGGFSMLLTGDAQAPIETLLEQRRQVAPVDVLKVGHHGSAAGTRPGWLQALDPPVGLISAGAGNPYGHPSLVTLRALQSHGSEVFRTDRDGTVEVVTDGITWTVSAPGRRDPPRRARGSQGWLARPPGHGTPDGAGATIGPWRSPTRRRRAGSSLLVI